MVWFHASYPVNILFSQFKNSSPRISFNIGYLPPKKFPLLRAEYIPFTWPAILVGEAKTWSAWIDVSGEGFSNSFSLHDDIARLQTSMAQPSFTSDGLIKCIVIIFVCSVLEIKIRH